MGDSDEAYSYLHRALNGSDEETQATADEYMLLIRYAFKQKQVPQESGNEGRILWRWNVLAEADFLWIFASDTDFIAQIDKVIEL